MVQVPGDEKASPDRSCRSFTSTHVRPLILTALAVLAMLGVMSTSVTQSTHKTQSVLRAEDVRSNDRCIVYTYFEDQGMGAGPAVETWKQIWQSAGWKPVVLSEKHAALHPDYQEMKDKFMTYPLGTNSGYELACYLRYLALASVGGGYMTDYDTLNVNVPPSPQCDYLPNDGKLTTHDDYVPAMVSGTEEEFNRVATMMFDADVNDVMSSVGKTMVSDMYLLQYFRDREMIDTAHSFYTSPNWISDPPCDANGDELPMMFHLSSSLIDQTFGKQQSDKPEVMREWFDKLRQTKEGCNKVVANNQKEYSERFLTMPGVNKFTDALKMHWECGHKKCEQNKENEEMEALVMSAKDKNGKAIFE